LRMIWKLLLRSFKVCNNYDLEVIVLVTLLTPETRLLGYHVVLFA